MITRLHLAFLALVISQGIFGHAVFADPDLSVVRAVIDSDTSHVAAAGRTRVDLVAAVVRGLKDCQVSADDIAVGPWLRLPKQDSQKPTHLAITVCVGDGVEGGENTAYIGVTPKAPFKIVAAVAEQLHSRGLADVRLLSEKTLVSEIMSIGDPSHGVTETASTHPDVEKRITN